MQNINQIKIKPIKTTFEDCVILLSSMRAEKRSYLAYLEQQKNTKKLWAELKNMRISANPKKSLADELVDPDTINNYFMSVFDPGVRDDMFQFYSQNVFNPNIRFTFKIVQLHDIPKIIHSLKSNAKGIDGLSLQMLKISLPVTLPLITNIINTCLEKGLFPKCWKIALVTPIPKVSDPKVLSDLRPISLLPILSKVLEKIVSHQLTDYT